MGVASSVDLRTLVVAYTTPRSWRERRGAALWIISCGGTVFLGLFSGLLLSTALSLLILIQDAAQPTIYELGRLPKFYEDDPYASDQWVPKQHYQLATPPPNVVVLRLEGNLNFANCERFADMVERLAYHSRTTVGVVFDAGCCPFMDMAAILQLEELVKGLATNGVQLVFANVLERPRHRLRKVLGPAQPSMRLTVDAAVVLVQTGTAPAIDEEQVVRPTMRGRRKNSLGQIHGSRLPVQEANSILGLPSSSEEHQAAKSKGGASPV